MIKKRGMNRVNVHLRVRPKLDSEKLLDSSHLSFHNGDKVHINTKDAKEEAFQFDRVFEPSASQKAMYDETGSTNLVNDVMHGYNATIMAYGATGSGKTYSMIGGKGANRGIISRALDDMFDIVESEKEEYTWVITLSYIQIYCELIQDLLRPESDNLCIREDIEKGTFIQGCSSFRCYTKEDCLYYLNRGDDNREVACTAMNAASSRSHACMIIKTERRVNNNNNHNESKLLLTNKKNVATGKLCLVDLCGSERVGKSKVYGKHFSELKSINLSLSALGNCIWALSRGGRRGGDVHVPYRDSKLTRLLSDSLGGNSKTLLVLTVAPTFKDILETRNTITFGKRAMNVFTQARVNIEVDYKSLFLQMQSKLDAKENSLQELSINMVNVKEENVSLKKELDESLMRQQSLNADLSSADVKYSNTIESMKQLISESGCNPEERVTIVEEINAKWQNEMKVFQDNAAQQINRIRQECEDKLSKVSSSADRATSEWHSIEHELSSSKEEQLVTLKSLRTAREEMVQMEKNLTHRIADLTYELDMCKESPPDGTLVDGSSSSHNSGSNTMEGTNELEEYSTSSKEELIASLNAANAELEATKKQFEYEIEKIQNIYGRKFQRLTERVFQLEHERTPRSTQVTANNTRITAESNTQVVNIGVGFGNNSQRNNYNSVNGMKSKKKSGPVLSKRAPTSQHRDISRNIMRNPTSSKSSNHLIASNGISSSGGGLSKQPYALTRLNTTRNKHVKTNNYLPHRISSKR